MAGKPERSKSSPRNTTSPGRSSDFQSKYDFVSVYLSVEDKQWLESNRSRALEYICQLIESLSDTYKLSCNFDSHSGRYLATLTCRVPNHPNSGLIMAIRGSTELNSLYALSYSHFEKLGEEWRGIASVDSSDFG